MAQRRRPVRRPTPNIEYGLQGGSLAAVGEVFDFNVRGILQADDNPRHYESVMLTGILMSSVGTAVWRLQVYPRRGEYSADPNEAQTNVRDRTLVSNTAGVPFIAAIKNINLDKFWELQIRLSVSSESDASATHTWQTRYKLVWRQLT